MDGGGVGGGVTDYITSDEVKATLVLDGTAFADADVDRAVDASNAAIEQLFGRRFVFDTDDDDEPLATDRYYSVRRRGMAVKAIDDLTRATDISVALDLDGDNTYETALVENTDYVLEPDNAEADGVPYEQIRLRGGTFPVGSRLIKVTGTFGWPDSPPPQIAAFAEVLAVKLVSRFREAPFGIVTAGADMGVAMRMARTDPDFPTLSAGLCKGVLIS